MACKIPYVYSREDGFMARVVIPVTLRPQFDDLTTLTKHVGRTCAEAKRNAPPIVADFLQQIAEAKEKAKAATQSTSAPADPVQQEEDWQGRLATIEEVFLRQHKDQLETTGYANKDDPRLGLNVAAATAYDDKLRSIANRVATNSEIDDCLGWFFDFLELCEYRLPEEGSRPWRALAVHLAKTEMRANEEIRRSIRGEDAPKAETVTSPQSSVTDTAKLVSLRDLTERFFRDLTRQGQGRGVSAKKRWTPVLKRFAEFIGHDDAHKVTRQDVIAYINKRLDDGRSPKTVKDSELAAIRAMFRFAINQGHFEQDPTANVKVRMPRKIKIRESGFADEEASRIISATVNYEPEHRSNPRNREHPKTAAAKRWVPLIMAHTGARVTEITQLRKEDVQEEDGIHFIHITPEAGSVKTGEYRDVPLHEQIIAMGFIDFVRRSKNGPLFYAPENSWSADANPAETLSGKLGSGLIRH